MYSDKAGQEHTVNVGREHPDVTVGRHPECVIRTSNGSVSRRHCIIRYIPDGIEIFDQGSSSGTYINERRVSQQLLLDGDEVQCGSFKIKFQSTPPLQTLETELPEEFQGSLIFRDDDEEECQVLLDSTLPIALVGRANECQIRSTDNSVSRRHSEFSYAEGIFRVTDLESFNGTFVNGKKVSSEVLNDRDEVSCGRLSITFYKELAPQPGVPPLEVAQPASGMIPSYFSADAPAVAPEIAPDKTLQPSESVLTFQGEKMVAALEETVDSLKVENQELREKFEALSASHVREIERENNQKQLVIDSFEQRYDQLKIQAEDQLNQIEKYRDDLKEKRETLKNQEYKLNLIQEANERGNSQVAVLIEENANLKVEVNRLGRQLAEAERLANLHEFEFKRVKGEMGNLQELVDTEGTENAEAQNEADRLRQVLDVKEVQLDDAERELEELRNEANAYREDAVDTDLELKRLREKVDDQQRQLTQALGRGEDASREPTDQKKLNDLKRTNRDQRSQIETLEETIEGLKGDSRSINLNEHGAMQRRIKELESALNQAVTAHTNDETVQELQTKNQRLESEMDNLREKLREASRSSTSTAGNQMRDSATETYERLNDVVSQLKNDVQLLQDYIVDVRKVYESYRRIAPDTLAKNDRSRIEKDLRELEPDVTFEELAHILSECVKSSEDMKARLLDFKEMFLN